MILQWGKSRIVTMAPTLKTILLLGTQPDLAEFGLAAEFGQCMGSRIDFWGSRIVCIMHIPYYL